MPHSGPQQPTGSIRIDIREDANAFAIKADIPGARKEDIQVEVDEDLVSIRAETHDEREEKQGEKVVYRERSYGMASRSFTLPGPVDDKNAKAEYKDGVLTLLLPKKMGAGGKRISIA
jgi:HSP20 family protein